MRGFPPQHVGDFGIGQAARDAMFEARAILQAVEAFRRAAVRDDEGAIPLVHIRGDELRGLGIGAGDDECGDAHDIGRKTCGRETALMLGRRKQNLAAEMAALLPRRELILERIRRDARFNIGLHDLEDVERAAEAGLWRRR